MPLLRTSLARLFAGAPDLASSIFKNTTQINFFRKYELTALSHDFCEITIASVCQLLNYPIEFR
jgi:hypothetical protein